MAVGTATAIGIGAALGAAKYAGDKSAADDQRKREAAVARFSPWTGLHPQSVKTPSAIGDVTQGAAFGGMMGQGMGAGSAAPAADMVAPSTTAGLEAGTASSAPSLGVASGMGMSAPSAGSAGSLTPNAAALAGGNNYYMEMAKRGMKPNQFSGFNNAFNVAGS